MERIYMYIIRYWETARLYIFFLKFRAFLPASLILKQATADGALQKCSVTKIKWSAQQAAERETLCKLNINWRRKILLGLPVLKQFWFLILWIKFSHYNECLFILHVKTFDMLICSFRRKVSRGVGQRGIHSTNLPGPLIFKCLCLPLDYTVWNTTSGPGPASGYLLLPI